MQTNKTTLFLFYTMRFLLLLFFCAFSFPVFADSSFSFAFQPKHADTLQPLSSGILTLAFSDEYGQQIKTINLLNGSPLSVELPEGIWLLVATLDDRTTPAADFASFQEFNVSQSRSLELLLQPVGSVSGFVLDEENRTLENARLELQCPSSFYDFSDANGPVTTDEYGSFSISFVPLSSCRLLASQNNRVGFLDLNVVQGQTHSVRLMLTEEKATSTPLPTPTPEQSGVYLPLFFFIVLFAGVIVLYLLWKGKTMVKTPSLRAPPERQKHRLHPIHPHKPVPKTVVPEEQGLRKTAKMAAILNTLPENERRIVEFLLEQKGHARQSQVYHALLLPKVTLSRLVFSLENKNILKTTRLGKVKDLQLTDWFLS